MNIKCQNGRQYGVYLIEALDSPHERIEIPDPGVDILRRLDMGSSVRLGISEFEKKKFINSITR